MLLITQSATAPAIPAASRRLTDRPTQAGIPGQSQGSGATSVKSASKSASFSIAITEAASRMPTPCRSLSSQMRSASPARPGASADPAKEASV